MSYPPFAEKQPVYSTAPGDGAIHRINVKSVLFEIIQNLTIRLFSAIFRTFVGGIVPLCRGAVGVFYSHPTSRLDENLNLRLKISIYVCIYVPRPVSLFTCLTQSILSYIKVEREFYISINTYFNDEVKFTIRIYTQKRTPIYTYI